MVGKKISEGSLSLWNCSVIATNPTELLQQPIAFTPSKFLKVYLPGHFAMKF